MEVLVYFVGIFPYIWPLIVPCLPYFRTSPRRIRMVHPFLTVPCAVLPAMLCSEFQLVGVHVGRQRKARPASKKNPFQDGGFCRSHQFRPPKRSTCKPHYVCIFIYLYYIYSYYVQTKTMLFTFPKERWDTHKSQSLVKETHKRAIQTKALLCESML